MYINQLDTARERDIKIVKKRQRIGQRTQLDKEAVPDERAGAKVATSCGLNEGTSY